MEKEYRVGLRNRQKINLDELETEFKTGYISDLGLFKPEEILKGAYNLFATTNAGDNIRFTESSFYYHFMGQLKEQNLIIGVKSAIELAKKLQSHQLLFNPNLIILYLGVFTGEAAFEDDVGTLGRSLQKRLYKTGGNIGYAQSSNDFVLYLGTKQEIGNKQGLLKVKKLKFEGTALQANSLDELLARIEQDKP